MNDFLFTIATFAFIDTGEYIDPYIFPDLPAIDPYSEEFDNAGYGDSNIISNLSMAHWTILANVAFFVLYRVVMKRTCYSFDRCAPRRKKMSKYFCCAGII